MRISTESINEARQNEEHRMDEQKTSDRFSELLKSKDDKSQAQQSSNKADGAETQQKGSSTAFDSLSGNLPPGMDTSIARTALSPGAADAGKIAQPGKSVPPQIEKLSTEIGHQIEIFKQEGGAHAVNINFDSKTLEGLQVQIRQHDGELAIRFITQSNHVSKLLSRHSGELREALAGKGVRIGSIAIASNPQSPIMPRNGHASA